VQQQKELIITITIIIIIPILGELKNIRISKVVVKLGRQIQLIIASRKGGRDGQYMQHGHEI
jgi:hypothetical protein